MDIQKQQSGLATRIAIAGELTLAAAQQLRAELLACLDSDKAAAELDLEQLTEVDLACLQVLQAAERSFTARHRSLQIRPGDCLRRAWKEAGYHRREVSGGQNHNDCG